MSTIQSSSSVKLGRKEKVGYALGDLASNFSYGFVSLFLLYFYTDIYGLTAAQASLIFLIARTIDANYNLLIGYVIDKTKTKHGKLRPYLLYGAVPLGALTVACFTAVESDFKFWFALCSYTIYCLAYTTVNTPYSAMTNMLTQDSDSRIGLSIYRFIAAMLGFFYCLSFSRSAGRFLLRTKRRLYVYRRYFCHHCYLVVLNLLQFHKGTRRNSRLCYLIERDDYNG